MGFVGRLINNKIFNFWQIFEIYFISVKALNVFAKTAGPGCFVMV